MSLGGDLREFLATHPVLGPAEERRRSIMVIETHPGPWLVGCDGCRIRSRDRIALVALGADVHLCVGCLRYAGEVIREALLRIEVGEPQLEAAR
jgi:hypothetical protein